jgi:anti-sigma28 factor (negative regulator of flagellin synthesis)
MKIYDVSTTGTSAVETGRTQESQRIGSESGSGAAKAGQSSRDHVELSSMLNSLSKAIATDGNNRSARVQALTAQYRSGNHEVNSAAVSRAMITDAVSPQGGR